MATFGKSASSGSCDETALYNYVVAIIIILVYLISDLVRVTYVPSLVVIHDFMRLAVRSITGVSYLRRIFCNGITCKDFKSNLYLSRTFSTVSVIN